MDYSYVRNEPRMDADQDETLAEFRSTNEPRRRGYYVPQVQFDENYTGPLQDWRYYT